MVTSLTVEVVNEVVDKVLQAKEIVKSTPTKNVAQSPTIGWRRILHPNEWETIVALHETFKHEESKRSSNTFTHQIPFYFGIHAHPSEKPVDPMENSSKISIFCTFYLAYSTWDGRMLYVDQFCGTEGDMTSSDGTEMFRLLAQIAVELHCDRLCWKETEQPKWSSQCHPPEFLQEWLFLDMDKKAIDSFLQSSGLNSTAMIDRLDSSHTSKSMLNRSSVEAVIRHCLENDTEGTKKNSKVSLRLAGPDDVETISHLVHQLAIYEKEPDAVNMTSKNYLIDGCDSPEPLFYCILADTDTDDGVKTCGMGLFFFGYVLNEGRFLYLEDLFVEELNRGIGAGKTIMERLALISLALDCNKFTWTALDWNTPSLNFYKRIGATVKDDLKITRYCGKTLQDFAGNVF